MNPKPQSNSMAILPNGIRFDTTWSEKKQNKKTKKKQDPGND